MRNAVIVIDMQHGFMEPEGSLYCGDAARAIIPRVKTLVENEAKTGSLIIFTADTHTPDDKEFQVFPPHCVAGTPDWEFIPEMAGLVQQHVVLPKCRYSAFFDTDLAEQLAAFGPDQVIVTGVCTDICVMYTAADVRNRDYRVWVPADCVASFDPREHDWALKHMKNVLGACVEPANEMALCW